MRLTLRILAYRNQQVPPAPIMAFGIEGGSIGRAAENAMVLEDPSRYISRVHARVLVRDGAFVLEDVGSNASVVNDRPLGKGKQVKLGHGDRVLIGDYLLQAVIDAAPVAPVLAPAPASSPPPRAAVQPLSAPARDMFAIPNDYDPLASFFPLATPSAPADATTSAHPAGADSEVLAALLRGLGLPDLKLQRPAAEVAEIVGATLREATAGTIDVLMARAATKKESRIDVTMLSALANNPLKFFPNANGALTQMLTGELPGYMPPAAAMAGAFDDLRAHELAVIAGMRAALSAVLERFDPVRFEACLDGPSVLDKMLSSSRKAKMWDRLVELYGDIVRETDDDLQQLYGEKFSEAYEDQVACLRGARN
jgi:FHA domain-containing protein/type VI secretion system protein